MALSEIGLWVDIVEGVITSSAIVVGGYWTYARFLKGRLGQPKAELTHSVTSVTLDDGSVLLRVSLKIQNTGTVAIESCHGQTVVQVPPKSMIDAVSRDPHQAWNNLHELNYPFKTNSMLIEPGESETYHRDVAVKPEVRLIQLHSTVACFSDRNEPIWDETSIHVLTGEPARRR